jgi:hypothetical protein
LNQTNDRIKSFHIEPTEAPDAQWKIYYGYLKNFDPVKKIHIFRL